MVLVKFQQRLDLILKAGLLRENTFEAINTNPAHIPFCDIVEYHKFRVCQQTDKGGWKQ